MENEAKAIISKAKSLLVLDHPFYASVLLRKSIEVTGATQTLDVDAYGHIRANPNFICTLTPKQVVFALAHECLHYMLNHAGRKEWRKMKEWNYRCDEVINDTLMSGGVGDFIDGCVSTPGAAAHSAEELYVGLEENQTPQQGGIGDDIVPGQLTPSQVKEIAANVAIEVAQAAQAAKMQGKEVKGVLKRLVDRVLDVPTPWFTILQDYMQGMTRDEYTWSRPNKRFAAQGVYLPSQGYVPRMGVMVLGVDTSGSIGSIIIAEFEAHMNRILEACRPEMLHVVYCDSSIRGADDYEPEDMPAKFKSIGGGGGTDLRKMHRWVEEQGIEPEVMVVLTDGHTPYLPTPPGYPVVWLVTDTPTPPWGEVVRFER